MVSFTAVHQSPRDSAAVVERLGGAASEAPTGTPTQEIC